MANLYDSQQNVNEAPIKVVHHPLNVQTMAPVGATKAPGSGNSPMASDQQQQLQDKGGQ